MNFIFAHELVTQSLFYPPKQMMTFLGFFCSFPSQSRHFDARFDENCNFPLHSFENRTINLSKKVPSKSPKVLAKSPKVRSKVPRSFNKSQEVAPLTISNLSSSYSRFQF